MKVSIRENYLKVLETIHRNAVKYGRNTDDIRLVVVTKTQPIESIEEVIDAGAINLGENYVEEAMPKITALMKFPGIRWHMIGHVQSRKADQVCSNFHYLHSLDSLKLAVKMNKTLEDMERTLPVYLEFNISGEGTKSGWNIWDDENWDTILLDLKKIFTLPQLNLRGVMGMPPYSVNPEDARQYFKKLRKFQELIINRFQPDHFDELSIGMSSDFEVALQEGSTCVRIGQAIFGPRLG